LFQFALYKIDSGVKKLFQYGVDSWFCKKKKKNTFIACEKKKYRDQNWELGKNEGFFFQTMFLGCHYKIFG